MQRKNNNTSHSTQPNPSHVLENATQPDPTHGWTQPMSISALNRKTHGEEITATGHRDRRTKTMIIFVHPEKNLIQLKTIYLQKSTN